MSELIKLMIDVEADKYCQSVDDDCLCQRTQPGTPVGEHIYCFCGCHIHKAFKAGFEKGIENSHSTTAGGGE
jgi:hypothetical protein